jgi:hypothetical protein
MVPHFFPDYRIKSSTTTTFGVLNLAAVVVCCRQNYYYTDTFKCFYYVCTNGNDGMYEDLAYDVGKTLLAGLIGAVSTYVILKKMVQPMDIVEEILEEVTQNTEMQKKIYFLGGILGNGLKAGIGLNKIGGKFKWEDMAGQLLGGWLQKTFLGGTEENPQQQGEHPFGQTS